MKFLPLFILGSTALVLAIVGLRAPARDYVAPTREDVEAHVPAPQTLDGAVPEGCVVRTIEVHGMCCTGCTGKLYARLEQTPGFVKGAVSFKDGLAQVVTTKDADPTAFVAALHFGKYDAQLRP
jgi:copper chaperone CopZ